MPEAPWKLAERRVCRLLGGDRRGHTWSSVSDCVGIPDLAVSIKRSKRGVPLGKWIIQAREYGRAEKGEWALVVVQPGQRAEDAVVCVRLGYLAELRRGEPTQISAFE